jgi:hypothetical protein
MNANELAQAKDPDLVASVVAMKRAAASLARKQACRRIIAPGDYR